MNLSSPSSISSLLRQHNLRPRYRFGQNFLADANTLAKIVEAGEVAEGGQVMEIGAGLGVLTMALANAVTLSGRVVTVEIDRTLLPVLAETVGDYSQVKVISADAMDLDLPVFLDTNFTASTVTVVANIPYNITSPLVAKLLDSKRRLQNIVLLVQKEVAQRLEAKPGTPEYGAFSVFVQYHCTVQILAGVSRRVFYPAPDVDSAILRLTPHKEGVVIVNDESLLFRIVRAAFGQRRKSLLNALSGDPTLGWERQTASAMLDAAGIDAGRRGETLSIAEFARIADASPVPVPANATTRTKPY